MYLHCIPSEDSQFSLKMTVESIVLIIVGTQTFFIK